MSVLGFALVVKSTTRSDVAAARLTRERLWRAVGRAPHVHDYQLLSVGIYGCRGCDETVRLVTS